MSILPLATREDLEVRLEFPLDDDQLRNMADAILEDASTLVRAYGVQAWDIDTAPPIAVMLTLKAAARHMNNPMFLETARGADETNMWGEANSNGVYLEPGEIALLREHKQVGGPRGFKSVNGYLHETRVEPSIGPNVPAVGYGVPGEVKWFPFNYTETSTYSPYYPRDWVGDRTW